MPPADSKPCLSPHVRRRVDPVTGAGLLLHPEGAVELSDSADAIVRLCDGMRTFDEIVTCLAAEFEVEPDVLRADVTACIDGLSIRGLLVA